MIKKDLFDTNASLYVLSGLMRKPLILQDEKYAFVKTDFYKPLQQMVFFSIYNMAQEGVERITPADIDRDLKQYTSQYEYYKQNKGYEFVLQCYQATEGSDLKQFDIYYNRLKKFSVLRDLESQGIDTKQFYDTDQIALNRDLEDEKLNKTSIEEILNIVRSGLVGIENRHIGKDEGSSQNAAKGIRSLVKELKENPEVGQPLEGDIVNFAARGARLGKLYTYSAPSGAGKTRYMVGNACSISMPYIDNDGRIVYRGKKDHPDYQKTLFVTTEQQADEIQTLILAHVSGVDEEHIVLGQYTEAEEKRISRAIDLIETYQNNFLIEIIPDPSIAMVKARLVKYIVQDQVEYIFYDYIFSSPGLLSEFRDVAVREDVALMMLSNSLKEIAAVYNVFVQSATQLNDGWKKQEVGPRDQNCLRGSKAIADKIDIGLIGVRLSENEFKQIETMWTELQSQHPEKFTRKPNIVIDIFKNRRGKLNGVKVFRYFDYATCRAEDLFVTDSSYATLPMKIGTLDFEQNGYDFLSLVQDGIVKSEEVKNG